MSKIGKSIKKESKSVPIGLGESKRTGIKLLCSKCVFGISVLKSQGPVLWHSMFSCHLQHQHPGWMLVQVLAASLTIHLPANVPSKALKDGPSPWDPAGHVEDQDEAPGFNLTQSWPLWLSEE